MNLRAGWLATIAAIFFTLYLFLGLPQVAVSRDSPEAQAEGNAPIAQNEIPIVIKSKKTSTAQPVRSSEPIVYTSTTLAESTYNLNSTNAGVYTGPGDIAGHQQFETWLGTEIPYTTDYIDYKGGWQADFIDSRVWLTNPWGKWVSHGGRRMVLGVPMLENINRGQFDRGTKGDFDVYFRNLASELVNNNLGNSIIRLGYEANCDTIGPWQATDNPAGYQALFRHEVAVMRAVAGAHFLFDWTVCNGLQNGHALTSFDSFYPGDDVVDIIGIDIYDVKWGDPGAQPTERWDYILNRKMGVNELVSFAGQHGKSLSFPEWGLYAPGDQFAGGGDNPFFIKKMAGLIAETKPLYQAYFNLDWGGGVLSDFPNGQSTYRQIFGR